MNIATLELIFFRDPSDPESYNLRVQEVRMYNRDGKVILQVLAEDSALQDWLAARGAKFVPTENRWIVNVEGLSDAVLFEAYPEWHPYDCHLEDGEEEAA